MNDPMTPDQISALLYTLAINWYDVLLGRGNPHANAVSERSRKPVVGDLVFETSHRFRHRGDDIHACIGVLLRVESRPVLSADQWDEAVEGRPIPTEEVYVIRAMDGRVVSWENASFVALPVSLHAQRLPELGVRDVESLFHPSIPPAVNDGRMLSAVADVLRTSSKTATTTETP